MIGGKPSEGLRAKKKLKKIQWHQWVHALPLFVDILCTKPFPMWVDKVVTYTGMLGLAKATLWPWETNPVEGNIWQPPAVQLYRGCVTCNAIAVLPNLQVNECDIICHVTVDRTVLSTIFKNSSHYRRLNVYTTQQFTYKLGNYCQSQKHINTYAYGLFHM